MPHYTGTYRWQNPATSTFEPVTVRGIWRSGQLYALTYRDLYFGPDQSPDPPIMVTVFMPDASHATMEWQDGYGTGSVISYHVKRNGVDVSGALPPTQFTYTDSAAPTGTPNPVISYTVYAITETGTSVDSDPFPIQWQGAPANRKPMPPTNFHVIGTTITELAADAAWDMSSDPTVLGFRIYRNGFPGILMENNIDPTLRSATMDNLTPATAYNGVNVRAFNSIGESNPSVQINFSTDDPGGFTSHFPGHQAGLVWLGVASANAYGTEDAAIGTVTALDRISSSGITSLVVGDHVSAYFAKVSLTTTDGKLPWVSVDPVHLGLSGTDQAVWNSVASGGADVALKQYFDMFSELNVDYVAFTFHPRGHTSVTSDSMAGSYRDAVSYVGQLWESYNGKANGFYGPIISEAYYAQVKAASRPATWFIADDLLVGSDFLGVDLYQSNIAAPGVFASSRLNYIVNQYQTLTAYDNIMVAVGELGAANVFRSGGLYNGVAIPVNSLAPTGSQWLAEAMTYVFANRDRYFMVSYADTSGLSASPKWGLDEAKVTAGAGTLDTVTKMEVYQSYITGAQIARQQGETVFRAPSVTARLDKASYNNGETMTLTVTSSTSFWSVTVTDATSPAVTWTQASKSGTTAVYRATAPGTATASRTITVRMTRTYDGRVATATPAYAVTVVVTPPGTNNIIMGVSNDNAEGNVHDWDAYRLYRPGPLDDFGTSTGEAAGYAKPKAIIYSAQGAPFSGSYATVKSTCLTILNNFYYGGTGQSHTVSWGIKLYFSNGNEMADKGQLSLPHTSTGITNFVESQRGLYDAVHTIDSTTNQRRFPDAFAGVNPTTFDEKQARVWDWLQPSARYCDFVAWSMYPAGRDPSGGSPLNPIYNWPTFVESDMGNTAGWLTRCFYRTKQALLQARTDTGDSTRQMTIGTGELGIGKAGSSSPTSPTDSTPSVAARNYYAVYGLAGPIQKLTDQYGLVAGPVCWWDQDIGGGANLLLDDYANANPHTVVAWKNWRSYHTSYGGSKPAQWASLTATQINGWSHTGNYLS